MMKKHKISRINEYYRYYNNVHSTLIHELSYNAA